MLTPTQQTALLADIAANTATAPGTAGQIKDLAHTPDNAFAVAAWYNLFPASDYFVWHSVADAFAIFNNVLFANYTPNDAAAETLIDGNRAMRCQIKQGNIALLLQGRTVFDATKTNLRSALNDATTNLPSGAGGASRSGGWSGILPILSRKARNAEKLFATDDGAGIGNTITDPRGANTNPDSPGYEGTISDADVRAAWGI